MLRSGTVFNKDLMQKMTFDSWKDNVDQLVFTDLGLHCIDLPDEDYWLNWDKSVPPQKMADIVIKNAHEMCKDSFEILKKEFEIYNSEE